MDNPLVPGATLLSLLFCPPLLELQPAPTDAVAEAVNQLCDKIRGPDPMESSSMCTEGC